MGCPIADNILAKLAHQFHILHTPSSSTAKPKASNAQDLYNVSSMNTSISLPGTQLNIQSEELPSLELFAAKYFHPEYPVLLKGIIDHWPAIKKWSPEYIVKVVLIYFWIFSL